MAKALPGYEYKKRRDGGYNEISLDSESNKFHPTQIMSAATGYVFPPYKGAGMADLSSFLTNGHRSTHLADDNSILGFMFNVASPLMDSQEAIQKAWPEIYEYGQDAIKYCKEGKFEDETFSLDFVKQVEEKFGKSVTVSRSGNLNPLQSFLGRVPHEKVIYIEL